MINRSGGILNMFINNKFQTIPYKRNINFRGSLLSYLQQKQTSSQSVPPNQSINNLSDTFQNNYKEGEVVAKDIYVNDLHGHLKGFRQFKSAVDSFRAKNPDGSVFISGDSWVGAYEKKNETIMRIQNLIRPDGYTLGNHEFDNKGSEGVSKVLDLATFTTLALNVKKKDGAAAYALQDDIDAGRLASSKIVEKNGQKFGYIGLVPSDLLSRVSQQTKDYTHDMQVLDLTETQKALQAEVDKLEKQGVNKITLVSHMGLAADQAIAKNVSGIDIIHGSHSHHLLDGIVPGENMFLSKRGEPVLITQAGKNGHKYGISTVVYDNEGKIINAENKLHDLETLSESLSVKTMENIFLGHPVVIGTIAKEVKSKPETVLEESPLSSFLSDAYLKYSGADIAFNNMGGIRASLPKGPVTDREIIDLMPFFNDVHVYKLSEKDVIDALNGAVQALRQFNRTGALQVAGLRYTIGKDDKVKDVFWVKKDGTQEKLNSENPRQDKFFKAVYNTFVAGGTEGLEVLHAPEKLISKCDMTETQMFIEYIKSFDGKPITIQEDGRIKQEK